MATINDWDTANWIKVCLTGRAQKAFQGLPERARDMYDQVKTALTERFKPANKRELYNAELQVQARKPNEGWADFAEDLQRLTEKAFPDLDGQSQEQLTLTHYLNRLNNPQVASAVKQQKPRKLDEAVWATLEIESFLIKPAMVDNVSSESEETTVGAVGYSSGNQATVNPPPSSEHYLVQAMDKLVQKMSQLEESISHGKFNGPKATSRPFHRQLARYQEAHLFSPWHYARGCALKHPSVHQGNELPPCHRPSRGG